MQIYLERMDNTASECFESLVYNEQVMNMNMGRIFTPEEAKGYFEYVMEYQNDRSDSGGFLVRRTNDKAFIGIAFLWVKEEKAEIEYMLLPEFWGFGYGTETARELINIAKRIPEIRRISGITDPENQASIRILLKNGLEFEREVIAEEDGSAAAVFSMRV